MGHNAEAGMGMTWGAGDPRSSPTTAVVVIVSLNREDETMRRCVVCVGRHGHAAPCCRLAIYQRPVTVLAIIIVIIAL